MPGSRSSNSCGCSGSSRPSSIRLNNGNSNGNGKYNSNNAPSKDSATRLQEKCQKYTNDPGFYNGWNIQTDKRAGGGNVAPERFPTLECVPANVSCFKPAKLEMREMRPNYWCATVQACPPKNQPSTNVRKEPPCKWDEPCKAHCYDHPHGMKPHVYPNGYPEYDD